MFEEDDDLMNGAIDCDAFRVMRTGLIAAETFPHEVTRVFVVRVRVRMCSP